MGTATVDGKVSDHDLQYLDDVANGKIIPTDADRDALTSRAYGRAAVVSDVGVAMAREFESNGFKYSVGVTPKYQRVDLFNYNVTVQNYDSHDFRSSDYRNTTTGFNADIGFATDLNANWTLGLVAQNIVPRSIDTKEVNGLKETFKIRPQVTAGASWHNTLVTTALDVDLTPASGFTSDKNASLPRLVRSSMPGNGRSCVRDTARICPLLKAVRSRPASGSLRLTSCILTSQAWWGLTVLTVRWLN